MSNPQPAVQPQPDPERWVDLHGDYLYRYALFRLRDASMAEDVVQETLLAALHAARGFAGRASERTWLVGILKHKITDYFRRASREVPVDEDEEQSFEHDELFRTEGKFAGHWVRERAPIEWQTDPAKSFERGEFWEAFVHCLSPLPPRLASAFTLREIEGLSSQEICEILSVSANNLWVMLHRARMHLRQCIEASWFRRAG